MTRSEIVFSFLILMVWGKKSEKKGSTVISCSSFLCMPMLVMFAPLWFVFSVYNGRGMQIQAQLDLLTLTRIGRAYETIFCLKDVKM